MGGGAPTAVAQGARFESALCHQFRSSGTGAELALDERVTDREQATPGPQSRRFQAEPVTQGGARVGRCHRFQKDAPTSQAGRMAKDQGHAQSFVHEGLPGTEAPLALREFQAVGAANDDQAVIEEFLLEKTKAIVLEEGV